MPSPSLNFVAFSVNVMRHKTNYTKILYTHTVGTCMQVMNTGMCCTSNVLFRRNWVHIRLVRKYKIIGKSVVHQRQTLTYTIISPSEKTKQINSAGVCYQLNAC